MISPIEMEYINIGTLDGTTPPLSIHESPVLPQHLCRNIDRGMYQEIIVAIQ